MRATRVGQLLILYISVPILMTCSSGGGTGGTSGPDQPETVQDQAVVDLVTDFVTRTITQGAISGFNSIEFSLSPAQAACNVSCDFELGSCLVFCPITVTVACPAGGSLSISGQLNGSMVFEGRSIISYQDRTTFNGCAVPVPPRDVCVLSGTPNTATTGDIRLTNLVLDPFFTFRFSGSYAYACVPSGVGKTVFVQVVANINTATGALSITDNSYYCPGPSPACS